MKVIPVIGDYGQFSRALSEAGVETVLVPFVDFMAAGDHGRGLSLSLLNERIGMTIQRLQDNSTKGEGP